MRDSNLSFFPFFPFRLVSCLIYTLAHPHVCHFCRWWNAYQATKMGEFEIRAIKSQYDTYGCIARDEVRVERFYVSYLVARCIVQNFLEQSNNLNATQAFLLSGVIPTIQVFAWIRWFLILVFCLWFLALFKLKSVGLISSDWFWGMMFK